MIEPSLSKAEFDLLSVNEKRVAICKDVMCRIFDNNILPYHGMFWANKIPSSDTIVSYGDKLEYMRKTTVKDRINAEPCQVCAKGALFCSWVGNFNEVSWDAATAMNLEYVYNATAATPELVEIFGEKMLDDIEAAFEHETFDWHYDRDETELYANAFYLYDLHHIMEYIVKNNGEFPLPTKD